MVGDLRSALGISGFALANAAWSVESGETLCTLAFVGDEGQERQLFRYEAPSIPESVANAYAHLTEELSGTRYAALVYDGYVTPENGERTDGLIVDLVAAGGARAGRLVQAYQAARRSRIPILGRASGFAIIGPPIVDESVSLDNDEARALILAGVREHPHGPRLFHLDARPDS